MEEDEVIRIPIHSDPDIVTARHEGRALAEKLGFGGTDPTIIATVISELARNIVQFAKYGEIILKGVHQSAKRGIAITATDEGPGIPDTERAMEDGYSTVKGLGLGLPGARRLMDEFEIVSRVGEGTTVTMRKWVR